MCGTPPGVLYGTRREANLNSITWVNHYDWPIRNSHSCTWALWGPLYIYRHICPNMSWNSNFTQLEGCCTFISSWVCIGRFFYCCRWTYSHSLIHPILEEMFCTYLLTTSHNPCNVHSHVDPTFWGMFCIYLLFTNPCTFHLVPQFEECSAPT
jgi:hypothetical protein